MPAETDYIVVSAEDRRACDALAALARDHTADEDLVAAVVLGGILTLYRKLSEESLLASPCSPEQHAVEVFKRWKLRER